MAASKQLVYIPKLNKNTWLLMTKRLQGACLRDYSVQPCSEDRTKSAADLERFLKDKDTFTEKLPAFSKIRFDDHDFWKEQIRLRNVESGLEPAVLRQRLQNEFKKECEPLLKDRKKLRASFQRWIERFDCVKNKAQFNHWDNDSAADRFPATKGIGWTSQLLEASRHGGKLQLIETGVEETKFSLIAMEVGLSISSKSNRFGIGTDYIIPDGIGLRKNGHFTVVEVKGPKDEKDLVQPLLQATCATLAVLAKSAMLGRIARSKGLLRPAASRAEVPKKGSSLGIHIIMQSAPNGGPRVKWTPQVEEVCMSIIAAFPQLKYIAYSFVSTQQAASLSSLSIDYLITIEGVIKSRE
jgi:hypothetical protein